MPMQIGVRQGEQIMSFAQSSVICFWELYFGNKNM
jgi:hypothetical protein